MRAIWRSTCQPTQNSLVLKIKQVQEAVLTPAAQSHSTHRAISFPNHTEFKTSTAASSACAQDTYSLLWTSPSIFACQTER
jgi:hypothetical protein